MKTTDQKAAISLTVTCLPSFYSLPLQAKDEPEKYVQAMPSYVPKDGLVGFYIIGAILVFGVIIFTINAIVNRNKKGGGVKHHHPRPFPYHRHHHPKLIKKTS